MGCIIDMGLVQALNTGLVLHQQAAQSKGDHAHKGLTESLPLDG